MSIKPRRFVSVAALALAGAAIFGSPASSSTPADTDFHKTYPRTPIAAGTLAGVTLDKLVFPGLHLTDREDHTVQDGGVVLAYSDGGNQVRVVVKIAVAPDSARARDFIDVELHGVQSVLPAAIDPDFGDYAFADDAGRGEAFVAGAIGNVACAVRVDGAPGVPRASAIMKVVRANAIAGSPSFPTVHVSLPNEVQLGGADITVSSSLTPRLRAEGAYVAAGPRLRPFGPGPVAVVAQVVDDLGRVSSARATATAR